jgi:hypothetical protein
VYKNTRLLFRTNGKISRKSIITIVNTHGNTTFRYEQLLQVYETEFETRGLYSCFARAISLVAGLTNRGGPRLRAVSGEGN